MNAQELIHALSANWIDAETDVRFYAWTSDGRYELHTITKVATLRGVDGGPYTTCDIEEVTAP